MHRIPISSARALAVGLCLAAGLAVGTIATAGLQLASESSTIYACRHIPNGQLRVVGGPSDCRKYEQLLSWNSTGPTGPPGARGRWTAGPRSAGLVGPPGPWASRTHRDQASTRSTPGGLTLTPARERSTSVRRRRHAMIVSRQAAGGDADLSVNGSLTGVPAPRRTGFVEIVNTGRCGGSVGWKLVYRSAAGTATSCSRRFRRHHAGGRELPLRRLRLRRRAASRPELLDRDRGNGRRSRRS